MIVERMCLMMKKEIKQEIEIVCKGNLTPEEQLQKVEKITGLFVDIATTYHVEKIKNKKQDMI
jgi:hypothetical protein